MFKAKEFYPFFVWGEYAMTSALAPVYLANAVEIPGPATEQLCDAALQAGIDVVIGVAEREARSRARFIARCSLLAVTARFWEGTENSNRLIASARPGVRATEAAWWSTKGLNCWEHNMVLPGYALMDQGTQIHLAAWPGMSTSRHLFLSRALFPAGCFSTA